MSFSLLLNLNIILKNLIVYMHIKVLDNDIGIMFRVRGIESIHIY